MQLMVTSVDDNIKYLKNCGAKHHIEMSTEIMYYTQGLQFRRREDGYLQRWITRIKDQPLKWRGILDDELPSVKTNSNSYKVRRLYLETTDSNCEKKHQALQGRATGESALYRLEGGWIGDFYEFFTEEFAGEEIP